MSADLIPGNNNHPSYGRLKSTHTIHLKNSWVVGKSVQRFRAFFFFLLQLLLLAPRTHRVCECLTKVSCFISKDDLSQCTFLYDTSPVILSQELDQFFFMSRVRATPWKARWQRWQLKASYVWTWIHMVPLFFSVWQELCPSRTLDLFPP